MKIDQIQKDLRDQSDPIKADFLPHFFSLEPGDKDEFLGVTVPKQRVIAKTYYKQLQSKDVAKLLHSTVHEERLTALIIWVMQYKRADQAERTKIYDLYFKNIKWVNNWDLVDTSAKDIVGSQLFDKDRSLLYELAKSENVWERRIAIVATQYFISRGDFTDTIKLAKQYLGDSHHYIHKATGWMLREVGKRDDLVLKDFLDKHAAAMPRTALRYAIEKFDPQTRKCYLEKSKEHKESL